MNMQVENEKIVEKKYSNYLMIQCKCTTSGVNYIQLIKESITEENYDFFDFRFSEGSVLDYGMNFVEIFFNSEVIPFLFCEKLRSLSIITRIIACYADLSSGKENRPTFHGTYIYGYKKNLSYDEILKCLTSSPFQPELLSDSDSD